MNLEIFVYLLCRFLGENRIYTVQCENSFTNRAHPRNWPFGLVIENRSCKDWHGDSFPQADSGRQPCGLEFCSGCGRTIHTGMWFTRAEYCSKCGARLEWLLRSEERRVG